MIGLGREQNGLYLLQQSVDSNSMTSAPISYAAHNKALYSLSSIQSNTDSFHVWHCRLEHPSRSRMSFLSRVLPTVSHYNSTDFFCTVCPLAK